MVYLENNLLKIAIKSLGAELCSMFGKENNIEYIWQAGKEWPKHSPVLFPIVGALKDNYFKYNGKSYSLSRHGFAREKEFTIINQTNQSVTFRLQHDDETLQVYPFKFILDIIYTLQNNELEVLYSITNQGNEHMYFSIGAHPAFNVPLEKNKKYEDYYLEFDKKITINQWELNGALISNNSKSFLQNQSKIQLRKALFEKDAIVCKGFNSKTIRLTDNFQEHGIEFNLNSCPFLGLWAAANASFICIEPWYGIADSVVANQQLQDKEGIQVLAVGEMSIYSWSVGVF